VWDSFRREVLYKILFEFGISMKLLSSVNLFMYLTMAKQRQLQPSTDNSNNSNNYMAVITVVTTATTMIVIIMMMPGMEGNNIQFFI
jgi:hypothetical protein